MFYYRGYTKYRDFYIYIIMYRHNTLADMTIIGLPVPLYDLLLYHSRP